LGMYLNVSDTHQYQICFRHRLILFIFEVCRLYKFLQQLKGLSNILYFCRVFKGLTYLSQIL